MVSDIYVMHKIETYFEARAICALVNDDKYKTGFLD